jgi:hypothetical protein
MEVLSGQPNYVGGHPDVVIRLVPPCKPIPSLLLACQYMKSIKPFSLWVRSNDIAKNRIKYTALYLYLVTITACSCRVGKLLTNDVSEDHVLNVAPSNQICFLGSQPPRIQVRLYSQMSLLLYEDWRCGLESIRQKFSRSVVRRRCPGLGGVALQPHETATIQDSGLDSRERERRDVPSNRSHEGKKTQSFHLCPPMIMTKHAPGRRSVESGRRKRLAIIQCWLQYLTLSKDP